MSEHKLKKTHERVKESFSCEIKLDYEEYLRQRKFLLYQKRLFDFKGNRIALTEKQINILKLVAKGFSNTKIAGELSRKESTVKLSVHRIMKYLELVLDENVDRFYLIIIAQQIGF